MNTKKVYRYDENGYFMYDDVAYESPLEPNVYPLPANCTELEPLKAKEGYEVKYNGEKWEYEETPKEQTTPISPEPTAEEIQVQLTNAVQFHMDKTVQARNYDNIATACTYSTSTDHIFATEGIACVKWRDAVWRFCYEYLAEVKAGTKEVPTADELIAMLPTLEW